MDGNPIESVPSVGQATIARTTETTALVSLEELEGLLDSGLFEIENSSTSLREEIVEGGSPSSTPNDI